MTASDLTAFRLDCQAYARGEADDAVLDRLCRAITGQTRRDPMFQVRLALLTHEVMAESLRVEA